MCFNLTLFTDNLRIPLPMVHAVLLELLRITTPSEKQGMNHSQADMAKLPDYNLFAIQLFHRW